LPFSTTTGAFPVGFSFNSPGVVTGNASDLQVNINDTPGGQIQFFTNPAAALDALSFPSHGTIGNRNFMRGPSFWGVDLAVLKNFNLPWEGKRIQIRWEMYNAFNHHVFDLPPAANRNIQAATFGQITGSASNPREMQFAFRFDF
jgi:hypothetical protein